MFPALIPASRTFPPSQVDVTPSHRKTGYAGCRWFGGIQPSIHTHYLRIHQHLRKLGVPVMPIPANQIVNAEIVMRGVSAAGGSSARNFNFVFNYRRIAVAVAPSKVALEAAFNAGPTPVILAALNARYTQSRNDVRWLNDAEDPYFPVARAGVGAIAGDSLSTFDAAYILLRTALRGRSFRGCKHLGPMSEADVTGPNDDIWNAAGLVRLNAVAASIIVPLVDATGNQWNLSVVSRKNSTLETNPTTVVANDVTLSLVNKRVGSLNSRKVQSTY